MNTFNDLASLSDDLTYAHPSFINAAVALDAWSGKHKVMVNGENRGVHARQSSTDFCALEATYEALMHAIGDLSELVPGERGQYLASLATARRSDDEVDPFRFRVAHLLATYVSMMPTVPAYGLVSAQTEASMFGWVSDHGNFADLVALRMPEDEDLLDYDIEAAMEVGQAWSDSFKGVRYLPLEDLANARYYRPDGAWQPLVDPARLATW